MLGGGRDAGMESLSKRIQEVNSSLDRKEKVGMTKVQRLGVPVTQLVKGDSMFPEIGRKSVVGRYDLN